MDIIQIKELIEPRIGNFLRSARAKTGLSREAAAKKLGYPEERLDLYENGSPVGCREFARIAKEYGMPNDLIGEFLVDIQREIWSLKKK